MRPGAARRRLRISAAARNVSREDAKPRSFAKVEEVFAMLRALRGFA
jgi:hypothetical protein